MDKKQLNRVQSVVRNIPDFPVPGIQFKDLTTAFKDPEALEIMAQALIDIYGDKGVTKVVGVEARGFIGGAILRAQLFSVHQQNAAQDYVKGQGLELTEKI